MWPVGDRRRRLRRLAGAGLARRPLTFALLLTFLYVVTLTVLHVVVSVASRVMRWTPPRFFAIEYSLAFALVLVGRLLKPFGRKPLMVQEVTWPLTCGPLLEALVMVAVLVIGFALFLTVYVRARRPLSCLRMRVLLAAAVFVLLLPSGPAAVTAVPAVRTIPGPARPVIVLAFDGVDAGLLDRAVETGRLPALERLAKHGFAGVLDNEDYGLSPAVWTSVITGKDKDVHQIRDFRQAESPLFEAPPAVFPERAPAGLGVSAVIGALGRIGLLRGKLVDGRDRRGPSLWQILSRSGRRSLVVNYMTSYPSERIDGVFLSQFIYQASLTGRAMQGYEYPEGFLARSGIEVAGMSAVVDLATARRSQRATSVGCALPWIQATDEQEFDALTRVTLELTRRERFDLVTFYTWWPDAFNHAMSVADYDEIAAGRFSSGCPAAFLSAYEKLDAFVAALRAAIPDADLILLSDHGVRVAWRGYRFPLGEVTILSPRRIERTAFRVERVLQHVYGCPGVVLADGPDVQRGHGRVSFRDVTPTLLAYFGLPLADDMAGRPVPGLLQATSSSGRVRSYDGLVPNDRVEGEGREMEGVRERLRALGYLQ